LIQLRYALVAICGVACAPEVDLALPLIGGTTVPRTVALGASSNADGPLTVASLEDNPYLAGREGDEPRLALLYRASIDELAWGDGAPIRTLVPVRDATSRLRRPDEVYRRDGDGWAALAPSAEVWQRLQAFRVDWPEDPCGTGDTCFDEAGFCTLCDGAPPTFAPPRPPEPWPAVSCGRGMRVEQITTAALETLTTCAFDDRATPCGPFERATLEGRCAHVGRACTLAADGWADALPADPVFVSTTTTPGDGSRDAPWDLATALRDAPEGATLALATGAYAMEPVGAGRRISIAGPCADLASIAVGAFTGFDLSFQDATVTGVGTWTGTVSVDGVVLTVPQSQLQVELRIRRSLLGRQRIDVVEGSVSLSETEARGAQTVARRSQLDVTESVYLGNVSFLSSRGRITDSGLIQDQDGPNPDACVYAVDSTIALERITALRRTPAALRPAIFTSTGSATRIEVAQFIGFGDTGVDGGGLSDGAIIAIGHGATLSARAIVATRTHPIATLSGGASAQIDGVFGAQMLRSPIIVDAANVEDRTRGEITNAWFERSTVGNGTIFVQGGDIVLSRARLSGNASRGLYISSPTVPATATVSDLEILGGTGAAIEARAASVTIERAAFDSLEGALFWAREGASIVARDVSAQNIKAGIAIDGCRQAPCSGFVARSSTLGQLDLERFSIERVEGPAFLREDPSQIEARDGSVSRATIGVVGLAIDEPGLDWRDDFVRVPFRLTPRASARLVP